MTFPVVRWQALNALLMLAHLHQEFQLILEISLYTVAMTKA
jgi:hypothetical protein